MRKIKASEAKAGMYLVNIGQVDSVELFEGGRLVRIECKENTIVMSAAFYWYRQNDELTVIG